MISHIFGCVNTQYNVFWRKRKKKELTGDGLFDDHEVDDVEPLTRGDGKIDPEIEDISYSAAVKKVDSEKLKTRFSTKVFFWLFVLLAILALFLFWGGQKTGVKGPILIAAIMSVALSIFFALLVFVRFLRARSITGGLFLTTCISTGVFLGTSQLIPIIVPPTAAAFTAAPDAVNGGFQFLIVLAQIGLYAMWFGFLLFTIYLYVKPVKRIDKYLTKIVEGDRVKRVRVGHARQYKSIEEKLKAIADSTVADRNCESKGN